MFKATLQSYLNSANVLLEPASDMGISSELKKSSKQQNNNSKPAQERVFFPPANLIPKPQDRSKLKNHVDPLLPHSNLRCELSKDSSKSSGNRHRQSNKGNSVGDGELVKHMSNLPGYLQCVEKGEIFQDKVLNVGVLDWTQLEQWKHGQKSFLEKGSTSGSCSSSNSSLKRTTGSSRSSSLVHAKRHSEQHPSLCVLSSHEDELPQNVKNSVRSTVCLQDFETPPKSSIAGRKNTSQSFKSFGRSHSSMVVEKEKIKEIDKKSTSEMGRVSGKHKSFGASLHPKEYSSSWVGKTKKSIEVSQETDTIRTIRDQRIISEGEATSLKLGSFDVSVSSEEKKSAGSFGTKSRAQDLEHLDIDLANPQRPENGNSIVLLLPKQLPRKEFSEVFQKSRLRTSFDKNMTGSSRNSFSESVSTKEINSVKLSAEISLSCPLASAVKTNTTSDMIPKSLTGDYSMELSSTASHTSPCSEKKQDLHSKGQHVVKTKSEVMPLNSSGLDPTEILNQKATELNSNNSRNPSPHRRFSFSLSRMGRSLSFKESSTVPQLSSTHVTVKSGPVSSVAPFDCVDNPNKEKVKGHNRTRSSPLRRLLDPILRHKEANTNPLNYPESGLQSKGSYNSFSGPVYSFPNEKLEESRVQALVQLRINSGIPLFRFVVNNNSNILAATMKNLTSSGKDDSGRNYTFYLVNEIKKKSGGWMSQGSKVKSCGYAYNVVGQMKVSVSDFSDVSGQDSDLFMVRESVLFGVERKQSDRGSPKFIPNRELAASVVKIPRETWSHDEHQTDKGAMEKGYVKCFPENQCSYRLGENGCSNGVTVILPGGVHSSPNKGEPSPLIHRWRSGGSCDCGGWDVGCKLQVLSEQNKSAKDSKTFKAPAISESFELYLQGVADQSRPIFSLVASKDGIYSVEYNTSISRLQAFFICVAVLSSSQKAPDPSSVSNNITEAKSFDDQSDTSGNNNGYEVKLPAKYAPNPPLSPVGRV